MANPNTFESSENVAEQNIRVTTANSIVIVEIHRPRAMNALSKNMKQHLAEIFAKLDHDEDVRAIVMAGDGGKSFCAGSDIKEMSSFEPNEAEAMLWVEHMLFDNILRCRKPVIAAVKGYALGAGCELAMCADIVIASDDSIFGMPELRFGAVNGNETALLMHIGGLPLTRRLILGCEKLDSAAAKTCGLVTEIVTGDQEPISTALKYASRLAQYPGNAYARQKRLILSWMDQSYSNAVSGSIADAALAWSEPQIRDAMSTALSKLSVTSV